MSKPELGVKVGYASINEGSSEATLHLTRGASVGDIQAAMRTIREELDFVTGVEAEVTETDAFLVVRAGEQEYNRNRGYYTYFGGDRREKLVELVQPKCTRKVTVKATVQRPDGYKHTGTLVTVTLSEGDDFAKVKAAEVSQVDGVTRARKSGGNVIVFSMATPAANDDEGKITTVVDAVAKLLAAQVVRPIDVKDDNDNAALDPANDYVAPVAKAADAS